MLILGNDRLTNLHPWVRRNHFLRQRFYRGTVIVYCFFLCSSRSVSNNLKNDFMASVVARSLPDLTKLEALDGVNYKRWSQKLLIFFEALEVDYVLYEESPTERESTSASASAMGSQPLPSNGDQAAASEAETLVGVAARREEEIKKFEKDNKTVHGHMLNHMINGLFDLFVNLCSNKAIWEALEKKYGGDDAGKKKYVVGKWLQFCMTDDMPIMEQLHEYENLTAAVLSEGMKMCEVLQANVLIEKFPPSWTDYRNQLKHKKRDLTLQELISHMRTEEANRLKDKLSNSVNKFNANLVETGGSSGKDRVYNNSKTDSVGKGKFKGDKKKKNFLYKGNKKIEKGKITCYVCGISGHKAFQCYKRQGQGQGQQTNSNGQAGGYRHQANLTESDNVIATVVVEANMVEGNAD